MRDVGVDEIPSLVDELNRRYDEDGAPYQIVGEGDGYRLTLRREFHSLRNRFYGRVREARLSQAAIDVLALVAYQQPLTSEKIHRLRGKPSSHILSHLVRRGLLRIERPEAKRRTPHYYTTDRFLRLFNLQSLDDLPRSEEPEPS
jgi:segregation and condensation protein B